MDDNLAETKVMLRERSVQELFEGYEYSHIKNKGKKRTTYATNHTEHEKNSLFGSNK